MDNSDGGDLESGEDSNAESDSVESAIDDTYRTYVLGFLLFFTVVIICYFG